jgi:hypothetical protein
MRWQDPTTSSTGDCLQASLNEIRTHVLIRTTSNPAAVTVASRAEFREFVEAVKDGEYDHLAYE